MIYMFGDYELDTHLYELRQAGKPLKVEPKVFDVLVYLVQHRDSVASKHALLEHLWPDQYISEATLSGCMTAARKAVGDSGRLQRVIQTLHGRGYRFVAATEERTGEVAEAAEQKGLGEPSHPEPQALDEATTSPVVLPEPEEEQPQGEEAPPFRPQTRPCPACQHDNSVAATFCEACGTLLLHPCPGCRQAVQLPATFCPLCGQHLEETPPRLAAHREYPRSRFIGREPELAALHELREQVEHGRGQVVALVGEAGIGKSWLLNEFRSSLRGQPLTYLEGRCLAYGRLMPYLPVLDIIRQLCGITADDQPASTAEKIRRRLQDLDIDSETRAPYLLHLFGISDGGQRLAMLGPETLRVRSLTTFRQMLLASSRQRPLIVAIEDLHWIDNTSADWIALLIDSLASASMLLLTTFRPEYRPAWLEQSNVTRLQLPQLTPSESLRLVHTVLPPERLSTPLEQAILARAAGNPLFLEQLTRAIAEQRDLKSEAAMPDTIRGVLMARFDHLPDEPRRVLQTASVLGRTFSARCLEAIWPGTGGLDSSLLELERRALCYEHSGAAEPTYVFKHALIQEVAYRSLEPAHRQALHGTVGQALEAIYADRLETVYDRLAYHYGQTTQDAKAVEYLAHVTDQAARRCAHAEVIMAVQEALARVERLPADAWRRRRLDLVLCQAQSLLYQGRFEDTLSLLLQQQTALEQSHDAWLTGRFALLRSQASSRLGAWEQAAQDGRQAIEAATLCHDQATLGQAYHLLATERYWSGQPIEGIEYSQQAIALLEHAEASYLLGMAHFVLGLNYLIYGNLEQALEAEARTRAIGEALEEPQLQTFAAWATGWVLATRGAWQEAIAACQRGLECSPDPLNTAFALAWLGYAYLEQGDAGEAMPLLEQAIEHMRQFHYPRLQGFYTILLGEAHLLHSNLEQARALTQQGLDMARATTNRFGVGWAQRTLGKIAQTGGAPAEARGYLQRALDTFAAVPARFEVGRTHLALGELASTQGDATTETRHVTEAYRLFSALAGSPYVERTT